MAAPRSLSLAYASSRFKRSFRLLRRSRVVRSAVRRSLASRMLPTWPAHLERSRRQHQFSDKTGAALELIGALSQVVGAVATN